MSQWQKTNDATIASFPMFRSKPLLATPCKPKCRVPIMMDLYEKLISKKNYNQFKENFFGDWLEKMDQDIQRIFAAQGVPQSVIDIFRSNMKRE